MKLNRYKTEIQDEAFVFRYPSLADIWRIKGFIPQLSDAIDGREVKEDQKPVLDSMAFADSVFVVCCLSHQFLEEAPIEDPEEGYVFIEDIPVADRFRVTGELLEGAGLSGGSVRRSPFILRDRNGLMMLDTLAKRYGQRPSSFVPGLTDLERISVDFNAAKWGARDEMKRHKQRKSRRGGR